jgi:hypothetical protein
MSETTLAAALAKFHRAVGPIHENSKAQYGSYADLSDVLGAISAPLADAGLAVTQTFIPTEGQTLLRTTLRHISGETVDSDVPIIEAPGRGNPLHSFGGAVTYLRRYSLLAILNLAAGIEDDDGDSAGTAKPAAPSAKPQPAKTVKTTPTPAQSQKPAAKEEKPSAPAQVEPPLTGDERELILNLLKDQHEKNRTAFDRFTAEYRAKFNVPERQKLSDHLKEKQHAEFTEQFFAALPPS